MAKKPVLNVLRPECLRKQWILLQVDHSQTEIIASSPVGFYVAKFLRADGRGSNRGSSGTIRTETLDFGCNIRFENAHWNTPLDRPPLKLSIRLRASASSRSVAEPNPAKSATRRLHNERALWMIALAGDFYVFAPSLTARLAAVLLTVRNIAAAWDVRAFLVLLVSHGNSSDRCCSGFLIPRQARRHVYLLKMADEVGTGHSPQP